MIVVQVSSTKGTFSVTCSTDREKKFSQMEDATKAILNRELEMDSGC